MHSMLNEFYDFIAKKIYSFYQTEASEGTLLKGESFCLKLDDEDMVVEVTKAFSGLTSKRAPILRFALSTAFS